MRPIRRMSEKLEFEAFKRRPERADATPRDAARRDLPAVPRLGPARARAPRRPRGAGAARDLARARRARRAGPRDLGLPRRRRRPAHGRASRLLRVHRRLRGRQLDPRAVRVADRARRRAQPARDRRQRRRDARGPRRARGGRHRHARGRVLELDRGEGPGAAVPRRRPLPAELVAGAQRLQRRRRADRRRLLPRAAHDQRLAARPPGARHPAAGAPSGRVAEPNSERSDGTMGRMSFPTSAPLDIDVAPLRSSVAGDVTGPAEDGYDGARGAWNLVADQRPAAVVHVTSADDVAAVVRFAAANDLKVVPQATGHGAVALPALGDAILLRTDRLAGLSIDPAARTARVEPGTKWGPVADAAGEHGLVGLGGSSTTVGVTGYTLGGGLGWLAREHGLAANRVIAAELVTGTGEQVRV